MRSRLGLIGMLAGLSLLASACGGGREPTSASRAPSTTQATTTTPAPTTGTGAQPEPECHPAGTELEISAHGSEFDTDCLAAPADTPFTITFTNKDASTQHNVAILSLDPVSTVFRGDIFEGETTMTYQVDALPAGIYSFKCSVHGTMTGQFVVE